MPRLERDLDFQDKDAELPNTEDGILRVILEKLEESD